MCTRYGSDGVGVGASGVGVSVGEPGSGVSVGGPGSGVSVAVEGSGVSVGSAGSGVKVAVGTGVSVGSDGGGVSVGGGSMGESLTAVPMAPPLYPTTTIIAPISTTAARMRVVFVRDSFDFIRGFPEQVSMRLYVVGGCQRAVSWYHANGLYSWSSYWGKKGCCSGSGGLVPFVEHKRHKDVLDLAYVDSHCYVDRVDLFSTRGASKCDCSQIVGSLGQS